MAHEHDFIKVKSGGRVLNPDLGAPITKAEREYDRDETGRFGSGGGGAKVTGGGAKVTGGGSARDFQKIQAGKRAQRDARRAGKTADRNARVDAQPKVEGIRPPKNQFEADMDAKFAEQESKMTASERAAAMAPFGKGGGGKKEKDPDPKMPDFKEFSDPVKRDMMKDAAGAAAFSDHLGFDPKDGAMGWSRENSVEGSPAKDLAAHLNEYTDTQDANDGVGRYKVERGEKVHDTETGKRYKISPAKGGFEKEFSDGDSIRLARFKVSIYDGPEYA